VRSGCEVVVTERRSARDESIADGGHAFGSPAGEPNHEIDQMHPPAQEDGIVLDVFAPSVRNRVQATIQVIAVERVDLPEFAAPNCVAKPPGRRRCTQDQIATQLPSAPPPGLRYRGKLGGRVTERLLA